VSGSGVFEQAGHRRIFGRLPRTMAPELDASNPHAAARTRRDAASYECARQILRAAFEFRLDPAFDVPQPGRIVTLEVTKAFQ